MLKTVVIIRTLAFLFASIATLHAYATDIQFALSGSSPYCSGSAATIYYDGAGISFSGGNTFTVQMSDASGSFAAPTLLGTTTTTSATGTITITFPVATGTGYRIRVTSSNPAKVSADNGSDITISTSVVPTISIAADPSTTVGEGSVVYFSSTVVGGGPAPVIQWTRGGVPAGTGSAFVLTGAADHDEVSASLTSNLSCAAPATATSNTITLDVDDTHTKTNHAWEVRADQDATGMLDRRNASGFSIGSPFNRIYIGCGSTTSDTYRKDFWEYDPASDTWTQIPDLPGPGRYNAFSFSVAQKGYVGMGVTSTGVVKDLYRYEPTLNSWAVCNPVHGSMAAREQAFALGIGGTLMKGYVGCGVNDGTEFKDVWEYNTASDQWTRISDFPGGKRMGSASFTLSSQSKGWVVGGYTTTLNKYYNDLWEFDGASWAGRPPMPGNGRMRATAFTLAGNGYVGLGWSATGYEGQFYQYNVAGNNWVAKPYYPGPTALTYGVGLTLNNRSFIYKEGKLFEYGLLTTASFPSHLCTTESIAIPYDASGLTFTTGNTFVVQVSALPDFAVSTTLYSTPSSASSSILDAPLLASVGTGTYYLRVGSSNPVLWSMLEQISVTNVPSVHTITSDKGTTVCKDVLVTFSSTLDETDGFQWYKNDHTVGTDSNEYSDDGLVNNDEIKASRTYTDGCFAPVVITSDPIKMKVRLPQVPTVTVSQPNLLTSSVAISYQWFKDDMAILNATSQTYAMMENGKYKVRVIDALGCTGFSADITGAFTGLENDSFKMEVVAYPSPFNNDMFVSLADEIVMQGCKFKLVNEMGQTVVDNQRAENINKLDLSGKAPGLYILKVSFGQKTVVRKLLKVN